jgi:hypothetical protein
MNYIKLLFLTALSAGIQAASAQVIISPGTTVSVMTGSTVNLGQDLTVQTGGTLNSDALISMQGGSLYDSGIVAFTSNSQLAFNGTTAQNMFAKTPITVASLTLNNATGLAPNNSITITNNLILINGIFNTDTAHPVIFSDTARNPAETNASHIVGRAVLNPRILGTAGINFLGCNISFGVDIGAVSIARTTGPAAVRNIGPGYTIAANWLVHSTNDQQTPNRNLSFSWLSALDNGRDITALYLYGSAAPFTTFTVLNDTATNVSATDPRVYFRPNISQFGRLYTLSDNKPLAVTQVIVPETKIVGFPNPFSNVLNLSITKNDNDPVQVQVMDMAGHVVLAHTYNAGNNAVISINEMPALAAGVYLLQVSNNNFAHTLKIVKTN